MIRVLHVVGSMDWGGVESWLMHVLRSIDRNRFQFDFCCLSGRVGVHAPEIETLGGRIFLCPLSKDLYSFNRKLDQILALGAYHVVHSHVHHFSGYVLRRAALAGLGRRVAHSHTAPPSSQVSFLRHCYEAVMKRWINQYATLGLGVSSEAMSSLFGSSWQAEKRWQLFYYGIDLTPFACLDGGSAIRAQYDIPAGAVVIGHVGRLDPVKNHRFLLEIAEILTQHQRDIWFLLVGDGPLRQQLQEEAHQRGLTRVIFTGAQRAVPSFLRAMDLLLFPSLWEGLPLAMIEAQAAGLRCLCADTVTREVAVVPGAVRYLSLAEAASLWADTCLSMIQEPKIAPADALEKIADSPFSLSKAVERLALFYGY